MRYEIIGIEQTLTLDVRELGGEGSCESRKKKKNVIEKSFDPLPEYGDAISSGGSTLVDALCFRRGIVADTLKDQAPRSRGRSISYFLYERTRDSISKVSLTDQQRSELFVNTPLFYSFD